MTETSQGRAFLVGVVLDDQPAALPPDASLEELALLADTAGLHAVGQTYQRLKQPDSATLIGKGKIEVIQSWLSELNASVVIFDDELSPRHQRVLEQHFGQGVRVIDRTALILDIFAQHAQTREGALQVELAQYEYRLPRLTRQWTHLVRQAGGSSGRGGAGGVGLRGPGETQLETDRREIRRRISALRRELELVRAHRARYRRRRKLAGVPLVALVGYTNAGKSTLLNRLSGSKIRTADQLFATLDPTTRRVQLAKGREALITDTVGFVQKLPHSVVAAFRATLEEIAEADLLLHVIDGSRPDAVAQATVVESTLRSDLQISNVPMLRAINKIDLATSHEDRDVISELQQGFSSILISARNGSGIDDLCAQIANQIDAERVLVKIKIPIADGKSMALFKASAHIESEESDSENLTATGLLRRADLDKFRNFIVSKK